MAGTSQRKETFEDYEGFVDKFKPKLTTDDCYTPPIVYQAVLDHVARTYGVDPERVVRPFCPGGDFESYDYSGGKVVVDNPPFSIVAKIVRWYQARGVPFFLFAPHLTNFSADLPGVCHVICGVQVTYENGANVATSFLTDLDPAKIRVDPELYSAVDRANAINKQAGKAELPRYSYPAELLHPAQLKHLARFGQALVVMPGECVRISALDAQREKGKAVFGGGYLVSEAKAAERRAAERRARYVWALSPRERAMVEGLGRDG